MATITVCGAASRRVQPDFVVVSLGLDHLAKDASAALATISERSTKLAGLLDTLDVPRDAWVTEGVHVAEEFEWRHESQVSIGYRATSGVAVTLRNLDTVGRLIGDAVTTCSANVRALSWQVDPTNPQRLALLGAAAADARARAEAYAAALDLQVGQVEVISDEPLRGTAPDPSGRQMEAAFSAKSMNMDRAPEMSVSGGLIELAASVYVRFGSLPAG